ncbi:hypothetical protein M378DRAFT_14360 [Amanita muscaria Koide BX008]|uniref:Uncharacterized protein n=1 Tax=Amanita muscaria (strain Koide BX008) TaxID=946122 RepID=A0A0C2WUQ0_AMAMK|nr:hypothetical protein M378DRAFT_14360 [Amanita muscaria Koide BX008]
MFIDIHSHGFILLDMLQDSTANSIQLGGSETAWGQSWKSDGALRGTLKVPGRVQAVALSNSVLVATWHPQHTAWKVRVLLLRSGITLWSLDTLSLIHTFDGEASKVSITEDSTLIAVHLHYDSCVALFDVVKRTIIATFNFDVPFPSADIHTITFLPDNLQLVVQSNKGAFLSLNLVNKHITKGHTLKHLVQLPNTPLWHGVPIWHCQDKDSGQYYFAASFSQHKSPMPMLWIPREISVMAWGSSMIALGCDDGRVILLWLPISHVS